MRRPIKILYLLDGFHLGGAESKVLELVRYLDKTQYEITVCSFLSEGELKNKFEALGIRVVVISRRSQFDFFIIPKLIRLIKEHHFQIVQTLLFYTDFIGTLTARFAGVPHTISWETISHHHTFYHSWHRIIAYRLAMKCVNRIVVVSNDVKDSLIHLRNISRKKIITIHYGVDLSKFKQPSVKSIRNLLKLNSHDPVIGVVARLDRIKGHHYLIQALPHIVKKYQKMVCLFIGDGEIKNDLKIQCQKLGLEDHVTFLGFRDDIPEILSILDLFVLPSLSEGFPNVILEAMASSVPVVASSVGGIPEVLIHNKTGKLVKPGDSKGLARAMLEILDNRKLKNKFVNRGQQFVKKEFSLGKQVGEFEKLYKTLSEKPNRLI